MLLSLIYFLIHHLANSLNLNVNLYRDHLSNFELLARFGKLVQTERKITHLVLECIAEIDSGRLYLDKAYPSLYEFLIREFGYSSSAALRRIESARLLREVPDIAGKAVRAVQKIEAQKLDADEKKDLLNRIEHTTQQQTEVILSQALSLPVLVEDREKIHRDESITLTITFTKEQMLVLKHAQDLIAHAVPDSRTTTSTPVAEKRTLRTGPKKVVLNRDRSCQFKDKVTGKLCGATRFLQVDHRQSVWAGGSDEVDNLRILCAQHNQHKYRQESLLQLG